MTAQVVAPAYRPANTPSQIGRAVKANTYALLVRGASSLPGTASDIEHFTRLLGSSAFPGTANIDFLDTPNLPAGTDSVAAFQSHFKALAAKTKPGDTFVLYITSHGLQTQVNSVVGVLPVPTDFAYATVFENDNDHKTGQMDPATIDFSLVGACTIIIVVDTCFSNQWMYALEDKLAGMKGKKIVFACSSKDGTGQLLKWMSAY